jgi:hypothetical protein
LFLLLPFVPSEKMMGGKAAALQQEFQGELKSVVEQSLAAERKQP